MPNHVTNIVEISGDPAKVQELLESIRHDEHGLGSIDFEKIIPMDQRLNIETGSEMDKGLAVYKDLVKVLIDEGMIEESDVLNIPDELERPYQEARPEISASQWELGKAAYLNEQTFGSPSWYFWRLRNWGTKWNAYDQEVQDNEPGHATLRFNTAWSAPQPILAKLAELCPELSFTHQWADEFIGQNCGQADYKGGKLDSLYLPQSETEMIRLGLDILERAPEDYGLMEGENGEYIDIGDEEVTMQP